MGKKGDVGQKRREVVAKELHDESGILVRLLAERVEISDGVVKGLLRERARLLRQRKNLIIEDGKIERQPQADRMRRRQMLDRQVLSRPVGL